MRAARRSPAAALLLLIAASAGAAQPDLAERVRQLQEDAGVPYVDLAVTRSDGPCTFTRYSDPVPRVHAASISELLTMTVVLQYEAAGALSLDDPLGAYLDDFAGWPVTLGELLTHTSGLEDGVEAARRDDDAAVARYVRDVARETNPRSTGKRWQHADANYNLLGRVLEVISGRPFAALMRERLFAPLGMRDSTFDLDAVPEAARVTGWTMRLGRRWAEPLPEDRAFAPSSGLQTTANDLARFARAVLLAMDGREDDTVSPAMVERMAAVRASIPRSDVEQLLGWRTDATDYGPRWYLAGSEAGREGVLTLYPEAGFAVVALGNLEDWPRFAFEAELAEAVGSAAACRLWF
jgi:CubicO group peptidase (beta-lactamase class C family)